MICYTNFVKCFFWDNKKYSININLYKIGISPLGDGSNSDLIKPGIK